MSISSRFGAAWTGVPGPVRGAIWLTIANGCFTGLAWQIRLLDGVLHPFAMGFFRFAFGLLLMLPWMMRHGLRNLHSNRLGGHVARALIMLGGMMSWFLAIALMPLAEVTALGFTTPLFATLGAALFLGEPVGIRRATATVVGFLGALVIIRPGVVAFDWPALLALVSAAFAAAGMLVVKSLSRTESPNAIVAYVGLLMTPMALVPASFVWTWPPLWAYGWLALMGVVATLGHIAVARAMACAEAAAVMPFDFLKLIFTATLGYFAFAEVPDRWTWLGGAMIFGAALYTARREARLAKAHQVRMPALVAGGDPP